MVCKWRGGRIKSSLNVLERCFVVILIRDEMSFDKFGPNSSVRMVDQMEMVFGEGLNKKSTRRGNE